MDEKNEEFNSEETPEDAEIRYLEQKLFAGKYKGEKGKKKLEKEWAEKDAMLLIHVSVDVLDGTIQLKKWNTTIPLNFQWNVDC